MNEEKHASQRETPLPLFAGLAGASIAIYICLSGLNGRYPITNVVAGMVVMIVTVYFTLYNYGEFRNPKLASVIAALGFTTIMAGFAVPKIFYEHSPFEWFVLVTLLAFELWLVCLVTRAISRKVKIH